jgi:hypothetical protein
MILFPLLAAFITVMAVLCNAVVHSTDDAKIVKAWCSARNVLITSAIILLAAGFTSAFLWPGAGLDPVSGYEFP